MNPKSANSRREQRLIESNAIKQTAAQPRPSLNKIPPRMLPEPWLFNSAVLLEELDRIREMILTIPPHTQTLIAINNAIDAVWNLRSTLQYLIGLHAQAQQSFGKKHESLRLGEARTKLINDLKLNPDQKLSDAKFIENMIRLMPRTRSL